VCTQFDRRRTSCVPAHRDSCSDLPYLRDGSSWHGRCSYGRGGVRKAMVLRRSVVSRTNKRGSHEEDGSLMIGCAGIAAAPGCVADSADADCRSDAGRRSRARCEPTTSGPHAIGVFHPIRLSNTNLCLQPLDGTTADSPLELSTCIGTTATALAVSRRRRRSSGRSSTFRADSASTKIPIRQSAARSRSFTQSATSRYQHSSFQRAVAAHGPYRQREDPVEGRAPGQRILYPRPGIPFDGIGVVNERCAPVTRRRSSSSARSSQPGSSGQIPPCGFTYT